MKLRSCVVLALLCAFTGGCAMVTRKFLYYPTHHTGNNGLQEWRVDGALMGYCRRVEDPQAVWLFAHGNGGQAADRVYALHAFSARDSVYIVEYPGYGERQGTPTKTSLDEAVASGYRFLRAEYPRKKVCAAAESIGSGPVSLLARESVPPDKIVLVVPFDVLKKVAADHVSFLPVGLLLGRSWDNIEALRGFRGPIDIYGARQDTVIPLRHAAALAQSIPQAKFVVVAGGHNDWPAQEEIRFRAND